MTIQHLKSSPVMIAGFTAGLLVAVSLVIGHFHEKAIDPRVTLEYSDRPSRQKTLAGQIGVATAMDGEVARTADRIAEAAALALSAGLYAVAEQLNKRTPRSVRDLMAGVAQKDLTPPGLISAGSEGTFVSERGSLTVRYRSAPLGIEVISIASKPEHGPALIVRVPGGASEEGEARLYIAGRLDGVTGTSPLTCAGQLNG